MGMTIEEQIMKLQTYKMFEDEDTVYVERDDVLKVLEQLPCEDAISRQAVLDIWHTTYSNVRIENDEIQYKKIAYELPSVTPSRPRGKWIHWTDDYKDYVTCSCCEYGEEGEVLLSDKTPFCPICGADMRESEVEE